MPKQITVQSSTDLSFDDVSCPFCGLLCDDLSISSRGATVNVTAQGCAKARRAFASSVAPASPLIDGKPATLEAALTAAARVLKRSRQPLFAGLATDVNGMRAALALGERCGAIFDHRHGDALAVGVRVLQSRGLATTTLAEVRNRADLVVLVGANINDDFQRFAEICLAPTDTLLPEGHPARQVWHLGPRAARPQVEGLGVEQVVCPPAEILDTFNALRASLRGRTHGMTGQRAKAIAALAGAIKQSSYAVFVWAPGQLDASAGDLLVGSIGELCADLNRSQRAAGLALGGNDGANTALATAAWTTGFPLRFSYAGETIDFDPLRYQTARLLAAHEVDALVWINCFNAVPPPDNDLPCVVIGTSGSELTRPGSVYLPAGTPGIDHAGQLMRTDAVVALPLRQLRDVGAASAASLLTALAHRLD